MGVGQFTGVTTFSHVGRCPQAIAFDA